MTMTRDQIGSVRGYTIYQIGLHWLIAALVFANFDDRHAHRVHLAQDFIGHGAHAADNCLPGGM